MMYNINNLFHLLNIITIILYIFAYSVYYVHFHILEFSINYSLIILINKCIHFHIRRVVECFKMALVHVLK